MQWFSVVSTQTGVLETEEAETAPALNPDALSTTPHSIQEATSKEGKDSALTQIDTHNTQTAC